MSVGSAPHVLDGSDADVVAALSDAIGELEAADEQARADARQAAADDPLTLLGDEVGNPGGAEAAFTAVAPGPGLSQVGAEVLGSMTGAPPRTQAFSVQVPPDIQGQQPVRIVAQDRASRVVTLTAPAVGFTVFVGGPGVIAGGSTGVALTPAIPYDFILPGLQDLYAVTDAPVFLRLQVQVAPLLIGDRERRFTE